MNKVELIYGCERSYTKIPEKYRGFLRSLGQPNRVVLKVPVRKNGLTGSGYKSRCHDNCELLVTMFGGSVCVGYMVAVTKENLTLTSHSVWMTPEGKLVCPTAHNFMKQKTVDFIVTGMTYKGVTPFRDIIPTFQRIIAPRTYKKTGFRVKDYDEGWESYPFQDLKALVKKPMMKESWIQKTRREKPSVENGSFGGFHKPSLATKMTFQEILKRVA